MVLSVSYQLQKPRILIAQLLDVILLYPTIEESMVFASLFLAQDLCRRLSQVDMKPRVAT